MSPGGQLGAETKKKKRCTETNPNYPDGREASRRTLLGGDVGENNGLDQQFFIPGD